MKTAFSRQLALTAGMILLSFVLLGCSFTSLFYSYMLRNEKMSLSTNAEAVAGYVSTQNTLTQIDDWELRLSVSYGASVSDTDVLITDPSGTVTLCSCNQFVCDHVGKIVPTDMLQNMSADGYAYATGVLSGVYTDERYLYGVPVMSASTNELLGYVVVSTATKDMSDMMTRIVGLFLLTAIVVLVIATVATALITRRQTEILRDLSKAARQFAHGDFSARIYPDGNDEEVALPLS